MRTFGAAGARARGATAAWLVVGTLLALGGATGCRPSTGAVQVEAEKDFTVCLYAKNNTSWSRSVFTPEVDKMTSLQLEGSFEDPTMTAPTFAYVSASTPGFDALSVGKIYKQDENVVSVYTAVMHVKDGELEGITWDDGCFFCEEDSASCIATSMTWAGEPISTGNLAGKGCAQSKAECGQDPAQCGLKVYVVWTGTDKNGRFLTSAGTRFSRFKQYSTGTLYKSARKRVNV